MPRVSVSNKTKTVAKKTKDTVKVVSNDKKNTNKKTNAKTKKNVTKKETLGKTNDVKTPSKKEKTEKKEKFLTEYYDLPLKYDETVVKVLAQTPKRLFVYWEVSKKDMDIYLDVFGDDFLEKTYPVLLVHNDDFDYTFEVDVNDFANSWYFDINDSNSKYAVKYGRKFKVIPKIEENTLNDNHINLENDFLEITDSNCVISPNDHILYDTLKGNVKFRNVKNGKEIDKDILNDKNNNLNPEIKELINELYDKDISNEILHNPSSLNSPSGSTNG